MSEETCQDCGRPFLYDNAPEGDDALCFGRDLPQGDTECWRLARDRLKVQLSAATARASELEIRVHESRALLQRLVKRVRDNEMVTPESKLGQATAQVTDYLQRTHDPRSILRTDGKAETNGNHD